ncbi:hypothetical protein F2S72_08700 [Pseudomonas syringae pv. actinidiae]|nr:hypothetical protein [Pseudomonas syringae pv. actinidiae]
MRHLSGPNAQFPVFDSRPAFANAYLHQVQRKQLGGDVRIAGHQRYALLHAEPEFRNPKEMLLAAINPPPRTQPMSLLTAITVLALAAHIHRTDRAVMEAGYRVLPRVNRAYIPVVLNMINAPSPLAHMTQFIATLPDHILTMKVNVPALPMLDAV